MLLPKEQTRPLDPSTETLRKLIQIDESRKVLRGQELSAANNEWLLIAEELSNYNVIEVYCKNEMEGVENFKSWYCFHDNRTNVRVRIILPISDAAVGDKHMRLRKLAIDSGISVPEVLWTPRVEGVEEEGGTKWEYPPKKRARFGDIGDSDFQLFLEQL